MSLFKLFVISFIVLINQPVLGQELQSAYLDIDFETLSKQVNKRVDQYLNNLEIIADKSKPDYIREENFKEAMSYFAEGAEIEVSNLYSETIIPYSAYEYLRRLMTLNYSQIDLTASRLKLTKVDKNSNGEISSVIFYRQNFVGYRNKKSIYADVTIKKVTVNITMKADPATGIAYPDFKFTKIEVENTKKY